MAKKVAYECDMPGCGAVRTPTNHWFIAEYIKAETDPYLTQIRLYPFSESLAEYKSGLSSGMIILCGEACVHKYISQNLATLHPSTTKNAAVVPCKLHEFDYTNGGFCTHCGILDQIGED